MKAINTLVNDVRMSIELDSFDEHLHGKYLSKGWHDKYVEPHCVAYISLESNEKFEPLKDDLMAFVKIDLIDNIKPKLSFRVVELNDQNFHSLELGHIEREHKNVTGGFTNESIYETLNDFADGIYYHEIPLSDIPFGV